MKRDREPWTPDRVLTVAWAFAPWVWAFVGIVHLFWGSVLIGCTAIVCQHLTLILVRLRDLHLTLKGAPQWVLLTGHQGER